jgi:shikimate kinase
MESVYLCIENELLATHPMRIFLIGYMASGKTRIGKELSSLTGYPFIDTDDLIQERYRISIFDFFERYGEYSFRNIERNILLETLNFPDAVIATGGGLPCFFDNLKVIRENGISVYLELDEESLVSRLSRVRKKRPLLKDKSPGELRSFIHEQLASREPFYRQATFLVPSGEKAAEEIYELIKSELK